MISARNAAGKDIGQDAVSKPDSSNNNKNKTLTQGKEVSLAHPKASISTTRHTRKDTSYSTNQKLMWLTVMTQMSTCISNDSIPLQSVINVCTTSTADHPERRPTPH